MMGVGDQQEEQNVARRTKRANSRNATVVCVSYFLDAVRPD